MNISPVNFCGHKGERLMSRQDSTYIYPNAETKPPKRHEHDKNDSEEPKITKTVIHWMNYGDGIPVPIAVQVAADEA